MRKTVSIFLTILLACVFQASAQTTPTTEADKAAIRQTALDYIEGWYEGNSERMERALHPDLAKRIARQP